MKIRTINGHEVLIDDEDYPKVSNYDWYYLKPREKHMRPSVATHTLLEENNYLKIQNLILPRVNGKINYHINGDILDNRKSNLVQLNKSQFESTKPPSESSKTGLKGVSFHKSKNKWRARINNSGKEIGLGEYKDPISAAEAYNDAAIKYFGKYAYINDTEHFSKTKLFDMKTTINARKQESGFMRSALQERIARRLNKVSPKHK